MKKQKHVEAANLTDLLNQLEDNTGKYQNFMLDDNTVVIGDVYIRRYYNIDPANTSEQYFVDANGNKYTILPNNKIWTKRNSDTDYILMDYSANEAEHMWYQIANVHQSTINANFIKFHNRQSKRELILMIAAGMLACFINNGLNAIVNKKQNNVQNKTEIPAEPSKTQINPVDTIMYNAVQHTK